MHLNGFLNPIVKLELSYQYQITADKLFFAAHIFNLTQKSWSSGPGQRKLAVP
jgi:hypothetical protein